MREVRAVLRWLQRLLIIALASMTATASAWACTCGSSLPGGIPQASFIEASLIARATMIGTEIVSAPYCDKHRVMVCEPRKAGIFVIDETLKGTSRSPIRIAFDTSLCGGPLPRMGETTWIAADGDAEVGYSFAGCMGFNGPPAEGDNRPLAQTITEYRSRLEGLSNAARQHASDPAILMELAIFLAESNSRLESISAIDGVLAMDPLHREANLLKAKQLARGPHQQAVLNSLAPYLAAHPDDHDAMHQRVLALVRLDRLSDVPAGWQDFTGLNGISYDFSGRKLNGASFRGNTMYSTSFARSELRNADFSEAVMSDEDFSGADLTGAIMTNAILEQAKLPGAMLDGADLRGANLVGADLRGASLKGTNLTTAQLGAARYDEFTIWPDDFDPTAVGAKKQP